MNNLTDLLFHCAEPPISDIARFEHLLKSELGATAFELPSRGDAKLRYCFTQLQDIRLACLSFGTPTNIVFPPRDIACLAFAVRGQGAITSGTQVGSTSGPTLASPGRPLSLHYGAGLEKVVISFRSKALKQKLAALLGTPISREPEFELAEFTSQEMLNSLVGVIRLIVRQTNCCGSLLVPSALRELEDAAIVQLLFTSRHKLSDQLLRKPPETSTDAIARAEQFIEANWNQPITIETLTKATGVSGRTLFRSFTKARGYSPMIFARKIRLEHAYRLLSQPAEDTTVTGVALACGFSNLGRFAQDYWNVFGELPSQTLSLKKPTN